MGVTRTYVFPIIRILLWALIAAALVKLAFGAVPKATAEPATPSIEISAPQIQVASGSVTNTVTVTGSIVADPAADVRATAAGKVTSLLATAGQHVDAGTPVLVVTLETPVDPTVTTDPATGATTTTQNKPKLTRTTVTAPVAGTLATLTALKDQIVSVGDVLATVSPGTQSATASLEPAQQYRLLTPPTEAQVTVSGGPAPFSCTDLRLGAPPAAGSTTNSSGDAGGLPATPSASLTCRIPAGVVVFTGMAVSIAVPAGSVADVPVVPVTAVEGSVQNGAIWKVDASGRSTRQPVTLGLTDGEKVQVVSGLAVGDTILQFIPVGDVISPKSPGPSTIVMNG